MRAISKKWPAENTDAAVTPPDRLLPTQPPARPDFAENSFAYPSPMQSSSIHRSRFRPENPTPILEAPERSEKRNATEDAPLSLCNTRKLY
jgi:hypothetical protein